MFNSRHMTWNYMACHSKKPDFGHRCLKQQYKKITQITFAILPKRAIVRKTISL